MRRLSSPVKTYKSTTPKTASHSKRGTLAGRVLTRNPGRKFSTGGVLNSSKTSGMDSRFYREKSQTFPAFPRSTRSTRMSRSPFDVLIVPIKSSLGLSGSGTEPSGSSLTWLSRAGSLRFRTTASSCARTWASAPRNGVFKYSAAISRLPLRTVLRKPSNAFRGVTRPRGYPSAIRTAASADCGL